MKRIMALCFLCMAFLIVPISPALADWKEDAVDALLSDMQAMSETLDKGIDEGLGEPLPNTALERSLGSAQLFWSTMIGMCMGMASSGARIPEKIITQSEKIHRNFLEGILPSQKQIRSIGVDCLGILEDNLHQAGLPDKTIRRFAERALSLLRAQMSQMFDQYGKELGGIIKDEFDN